MKLPLTWSTAHLEDVCDILDSKRIPVNNTDRNQRIAGRNENKLFPYYGATGQVGVIDDFIFEGQHVLVGEDGAPFLDPVKNKAYVATGKFWVNNHAHILKSKFSNNFLCYFLNQFNYSGFVTGTTRLKLNQAALKVIPVVIPPLNEQKRIVAKIEELFSELDNGVSSLQTAREQLKVYRQAVLKHAFEGKLTAQWREENKADAWQAVKLGDLTSFLTSGSRGWAKYYSDNGDIFIRAQNLKHDRLNLDDIAFVSLPEKSEGKRTQVQLGDILITITGANVTKTGRVNADIGTAYVSQHVALCRPTDKIDSEFMHWFLIAESAGRKQLNKFAYGAGKPGLNLENIRSVELSLPAVAEQRLIVKKIKMLLSVAEKTALDIDSEIKRSASLRQSILKKAFSGQLVPQNPNDEPASELLARIKAEREAEKISNSRKKPSARHGQNSRKANA